MLGQLTKQLTEGSELADGPYASAVQDAFSGPSSPTAASASASSCSDR